jgi:hypothetical protein|tara:strand:- start:45 stop:524 length:480 start_codon:yes stop_codon:yes gene_type:complete
MVPTLASAALLMGIGFSGLTHHEGRSALNTEWLGGDSELDQLDQREATLHQRRGAQEMLSAFTRAQLTRHYWGAFASSLTDLGLMADPSLQARVVNGPGFTQLWLTPRRGDEVYFSQVRANGGNLVRLQCRGPSIDSVKSKNVQPNLNECPPGWIALSS